MEHIPPEHRARVPGTEIKSMGRIGENRFERHPVLGWLSLAFIVLVLSELVLRIVNPSFVEFPYRLRQYISYHQRWKADFIPDTTSWVRLRGNDNLELLNFLVTVGEDGFRTWDRELDNNVVSIAKNTKIVHAIGDSHTMGWGINFESSYPAQLDFLLPRNMRVIDLGLNNFGTIAATEKSMGLWGKYPGSLSIYLFCENDYDDDRIATRHNHRPAVVHTLFSVWNYFRRNSYCANLPYAVYEWGYWESLRKTGKRDIAHYKKIYVGNPEHLNFSRPEQRPSDRNKGILSKEAMLKYKSFLDARSVPLWVLCFGDNDNSRDFCSFCSENGIKALVMTVPDSLILSHEGHMNQLGNFQLAKFISELMKSKGMLNGSTK
jgi:hypothetical protein